MGFWIQNDVIWRKTNPMPNFRGKRFTNAHETLIWAARDQKSKPTFNYEAMKAFNDDVQMRSDWLIPICSGPERLKDDGGRKAHPTQKPEALLYRVLLASTRKGDVVLDPFFGTGTTGAVAKKLGRRWIGIEADADYAKAAAERIADVVPLSASALEMTRSKRTEPRVPFGTIVDLQMIKPGQRLWDERGKICAEVRADGTLALPGSIPQMQGSIHRLGAEVQGKAACNGWTFWHFEAEGRRKPIDALREDARRQLGLGDHHAPTRLANRYSGGVIIFRNTIILAAVRLEGFASSDGTRVPQGSESRSFFVQGRLSGTRARRFWALGRQGCPGLRPGACALSYTPAASQRSPWSHYWGWRRLRPDGLKPPGYRTAGDSLLPGAAAPCPAPTGSITAVATRSGPIMRAHRSAGITSATFVAAW